MQHTMSMVRAMDDKVLLGPGPDRWPGYPTQKPVESGGNSAEPLATAASSQSVMDDRHSRQTGIVRLKVLSAVQMAALLFSEDEVRAIVEQALANIKARGDRSEST